MVEIHIGPSSRATAITMRTNAPFEAPQGRLPAVASLVSATTALPSSGIWRANAAMSKRLARVDRDVLVKTLGGRIENP